jgi:GrpB-like predicted nucleotidyltransferase (UPF0157 family)
VSDIVTDIQQQQAGRALRDYLAAHPVGDTERSQYECESNERG